MAELVSVAFERMTALEVAWQNALNDRVRDVVEGGEDDLDGPIGEVIKSVVARRMTQAPAQPNGSAPKPNGKGKA
jgi:methyl coenzyme M reductase beta subunit